MSFWWLHFVLIWILISGRINDIPLGDDDEIKDELESKKRANDAYNPVNTIHGEELLNIINKVNPANAINVTNAAILSNVKYNTNITTVRTRSIDDEQYVHVKDEFILMYANNATDAMISNVTDNTVIFCRSIDDEQHGHTISTDIFYDDSYSSHNDAIPQLSLQNDTQIFVPTLPFYKSHVMANAIASNTSKLQITDQCLTNINHNDNDYVAIALFNDIMPSIIDYDIHSNARVQSIDEDQANYTIPSNAFNAISDVIIQPTVQGSQIELNEILKIHSLNDDVTSQLLLANDTHTTVRAQSIDDDIMAQMMILLPNEMTAQRSQYFLSLTTNEPLNTIAIAIPNNELPHQSLPRGINAAANHSVFDDDGPTLPFVFIDQVTPHELVNEFYATRDNGDNAVSAHDEVNKNANDAYDPVNTTTAAPIRSNVNNANNNANITARAPLIDAEDEVKDDANSTINGDATTAVNDENIYNAINSSMFIFACPYTNKCDVIYDCATNDTMNINDANNAAVAPQPNDNDDIAPSNDINSPNDNIYDISLLYSLLNQYNTSIIRMRWCNQFNEHFISSALSMLLLVRYLLIPSTLFILVRPREPASIAIVLTLNSLYILIGVATCCIGPILTAIAPFMLFIPCGLSRYHQSQPQYMDFILLLLLLLHIYLVLPFHAMHIISCFIFISDIFCVVWCNFTIIGILCIIMCYFKSIFTIYIINSIIIYCHITRCYKLTICTIYITICYINIKCNCNTWICCYFINTLAPFILSPASLYSFAPLILSIIATTHGFGAALRYIYILVCLPGAILILSSTAPLISCIDLVAFTFTTAATHAFNTIHKPAPISSLLATTHGFATLLNAVVTFTLNDIMRGFVFAAMLNIYNYVKVSYLLSPGAYFTLNGSLAALIPSAPSAPPFISLPCGLSVLYYFIPTYFGLAGAIIMLPISFAFAQSHILSGILAGALLLLIYFMSSEPGATLMVSIKFGLPSALLFNGTYFGSSGAILMVSMSFGLPGTYYLLTTAYFGLLGAILIFSASLPPSGAILIIAIRIINVFIITRCLFYTNSFVNGICAMFITMRCIYKLLPTLGALFLCGLSFRPFSNDLAGDVCGYCCGIKRLGWLQCYCCWII